MAKSILVADSSATIRRVVELTFSNTEFYVESAGSGREALERFERLQPDLVLLDVGLAEPAGYEICRRIKASSHPVPVLLLAGAFEPFDARLAADCGAEGHLFKPFEARALERSVEQLLVAAAGAAAPRPAAVPPVVALPTAAEEAAAASARRVEALVRAEFERIAEPLLRELARELLPQIAERVVRERIHELEREES